MALSFLYRKEVKNFPAKIFLNDLSYFINCVRTTKRSKLKSKGIVANIVWIPFETCSEDVKSTIIDDNAAAVVFKLMAYTKESVTITKNSKNFLSVF